MNSMLMITILSRSRDISQVQCVHKQAELEISWLYLIVNQVSQYKLASLQRKVGIHYIGQLRCFHSVGKSETQICLICPLDQRFWVRRPLIGHTALLVSHKARYHTLCQLTYDVNLDHLVVLFIKVTALPFVTYQSFVKEIF